MWETVEPISYTLILYSTIGYVTAGLILILHTHRPDLKRAHPKLTRIVIWALSAINLVTGFTALLTPQPNVGTMTLPLGLLAYTGVFAAVGGLLGFFGTSQYHRKLAQITRGVLATALIVSLGWLGLVWLMPLMSAIPQYPAQALILLVVIVVTVWLGLYVRHQPSSTLKQKVIRITFYLMLLAESAFMFVMANNLLLFFLAMALHP